jgi:hypothetical protein
MIDQANMTPEEYQTFLEENQAILENIEDYVDRGFLPPYHPHCRGRIIKHIEQFSAKKDNSEKHYKKIIERVDKFASEIEGKIARLGIKNSPHNINITTPPVEVHLNVERGEGKTIKKIVNFNRDAKGDLKEATILEKEM